MKIDPVNPTLKIPPKYRWAAIFLFGIICSAFLPFFIHDWTYDAICYLNIARKYAEGNFEEAVNGYWSPLYSALIAIFLKTGLEPQLAAKLLNVLIAMAALGVWMKLLLHFRVAGWKFWLAVSAMSINLAWYAWTFITPDLLFFFFAMLFLERALRGKLFFQAWKTGLLGFALYISKSFGFFFFLAYFAFAFLLEIYTRRGEGIRTLKNFILGLGIFSILSFAWINELHDKYNTWTVTTASSYNHAVMKSGTLLNDFLNAGLLPAPDRNSTFAWDDISKTYQVKDWSIFESKDNFRLQLDIWFRNLLAFFRLFITHNPGGLVFFLGAFILLAGNKIPDPEVKRLMRILLSFSLIFITGYGLRFFEARYIWIIFAIGTLLALKLSGEKNNWFPVSHGMNSMLVAVTLLLFAFRPAYEFRNAGKGNPGWDFAGDVSALNFKKGTRIASWTTSDTWIISWRNGWQDFGGISSYGKEGEAYEDLKKFRVDYVIVPDTLIKLPFYLNDSTRIKENVRLIEVYKVR